MDNKTKFIRIISFGNPTYINVQYIESIISIDGKTRIWPVNGEGYFETDEPLEEIMRKIQEKG